MRIGIDLGGTTVKAALCTEDGTLLCKDSLPTRTGNAAGLKADMKTLALSLCRAHSCAVEDVTAIGIGVPGSFDKKTCTLRFGTNLGLNNVSFADAFLPEFGCPVHLDNDANCAALGEATAGAAKGMRNMLMVTLGTGVGGGIIINGQLYTGCNGIAGEIGHMVIRKDGEPCNCGRRGCLEAYCSAASLVRFAERALEDGRKSVLAVHKGQLNAKQICDAVDAGDALAQELFDEYCGNLANGLASFVNLFQPESIVLGGGLAGYGEKSCSSRCACSLFRRPSAVRTEIPRSSVRRSAMTQVWWAQRCLQSNRLRSERILPARQGHKRVDPTVSTLL